MMEQYFYRADAADLEDLIYENETQVLSER